jgi:hypothetical protein
LGINTQNKPLANTDGKKKQKKSENTKRAASHWQTDLGDVRPQGIDNVHNQARVALREHVEGHEVIQLRAESILLLGVDLVCRQQQLLEALDQQAADL